MVILNNPILYFSAALLMVTASFYFFRINNSIYKRGGTAIATVVNVVDNPNSDITGYYPVLSYKVEKKPYTITWPYSSYAWKNSKGKKISIVFEKDKPHKIHIASPWGLHGFSILLSSLGVACLSIGCWLLWLNNQIPS